MLGLRVLIFAIVCGAIFLIWLIPFVFNQQQFFEQKSSPLWSATIPLILTIAGLLLFWQFAARASRKRFHFSRFARAAANESNFIAHTLNTVVSNLERERRKQSLRAETAEEFNQRVISGLPSGLIAFDHRGRVRLANESAYEILFGKKVDLENLPAETVFQNIPALADFVSKTIKTGVAFGRESLIMQAPDGKRRIIGATISPLSDANDENQRSALCLLKDITEINELREQLALRQNLAALGEMSAGLTHEFKNSLAAIQTLAQFLQTIQKDERQLQASSAIISEINILSQIVNSFLDFARPRKLDLQNFSLAELIEECLTDVASNARSSLIVFQTNGILPVVCGDQQLLKRVFLNLLRNAYQACEEAAKPSGVIIVSGRIIVEQNGKKWAEIEIEDSGSGIKEENLTMVFVPFFTTKAQGHGIGLALAHRIVSEHGGQLACGNSNSGGAVFTCRLPLE